MKKIALFLLRDVKRKIVQVELFDQSFFNKLTSKNNSTRIRFKKVKKTFV